MIQLILPFKSTPRLTFDSLIVHEGIKKVCSAIQTVYATRDRPFSSLFIYGSSGTGKTHILNAMIALFNSRYKGKYSIRLIFPTGDPPTFSFCEVLGFTSEETELSGLAIDDAHLMGNGDCGHFWNIFNKLTLSGLPIILTAQTSPRDTFKGNPHLQSRILSGLVFGLEPPDDKTRVMIMDKIARDRNIKLPPEVCTYLITHKSRNTKKLEQIIEILDKNSLQLKRRITLPFVKMLEHKGLF